MVAARVAAPRVTDSACKYCFFMALLLPLVHEGIFLWGRKMAGKGLFSSSPALKGPMPTGKANRQEI
jgi:hypothetical protein